MKLHDFYYELPKELIAQAPLNERDMSRLMVLDRADESVTEKKFRDIVHYIKKGDCLVLNNTRVVPVRLYGQRQTGGKVEIFILDPYSDKPRALVRPSKRIKDGEKISLGKAGEVLILGKADLGRFVRFSMPIREVLKYGHIPLPPYISREDTKEDAECYQTVYARKDGATASPTAGLHFTGALLDKLTKNGVSIVYVTLHTSYGTFAPVTALDIENHLMHKEYYELEDDSARVINNVKNAGGRIFSVGTTSTRVLETCTREPGRVFPGGGETNLFIYPGYKFKIVDAVITNFHFPESTLLMLVSAFSGREFILKAYRQAVRDKFRFFSYGDAMLII
ncbi:MAG: tRNA preQ1(34) S-adenosylmethionine ribosyltransferase-isomerase QueA [Candidatus Omnitrophota bacterium]